MVVTKGFTPKRTVYTLDFSDTELDGLQVQARSVSVGTLLEFTSMADLAERLTGEQAGQADGLEVMRVVGDLLASFAEVLRGWNLLDDNGNDVPATLAGLRTLEFRHAMAIITTWTRAASDVPAPLSNGSSGGVPPPGLSIPMDVSSPSQAS
jgi:hypothetical protein